MKRYCAASWSLCAVFGLVSVIACGSGGEDPATAGASGTGTPAGAGGNTGGTPGTGGTPAGAGNTTGATGGAATAGTGGAATAGTGGTSTGASVCDGATRELPLEEAYLDNFETETRWLGWYEFADDGEPEPHAPTREGPGALSTESAIHVSASTIKTPTAGGYGAGFGFGMIDPALEKCVDVSAFDGISFWAKGTSGADNKLVFQIVHPATAPVEDGGDCVQPGCYVHPKKEIELTADWTQYTITWADLSAPAVTGPILGFNMITAGAAYDVWIDEVTLYAGTAPTGPVSPPDDGAGGSGG